jgi:hypothetical protein
MCRLQKAAGMCMQLFDLLASTACPQPLQSLSRINDASLTLLAIAACRKQPCAEETDEEAECKRRLTVAADYVHRVLQSGFSPGETFDDVDQVSLSNRVHLPMGRYNATCCQLRHCSLAIASSVLLVPLTCSYVSSRPVSAYRRS